MRKIVPILFYGNLFYGICAVALCYDANLQHNQPANHPLFYLLVFIATWLYYTRIYYKSRKVLLANPRTQWYLSNLSVIKKSLVVGIGILVVVSMAYLFRLPYLSTLPPQHWALLMIFPLVGIFYTFDVPAFGPYRAIRRIGWLKPFFIGFTWSGLTAVYPVVLVGVETDLSTPPSFFYWLQSFLYISALAVLFDIKDYTVDLKVGLKTYPTQWGIKKTLAAVVLPATLLSAAGQVFFLYQHQPSPVVYLVQVAPFVLLLALSPMVQRQSSILFYLVVIDGLMLLKALAGITTVHFYK